MSTTLLKNAPTIYRRERDHQDRHRNYGYPREGGNHQDSHYFGEEGSLGDRDLRTKLQRGDIYRGHKDREEYEQEQITQRSMRTIIAEVLRETLDMREGRDLMLDTGTRKKQDQGHKNGNLDQTFRAEELNTHSPGEHQDDRGWSYSKKNTSLEQTTAEALQILKKNETQSLA